MSREEIDWTEQKYDLEFRPELIKAVKARHNLSDTKLAKILGVSTPLIWIWENSQRKVTSKYLPKLYELLESEGVNPDEKQEYVNNIIADIVNNLGIERAEILIKIALRNT